MYRMTNPALVFGAATEAVERCRESVPAPRRAAALDAIAEAWAAHANGERPFGHLNRALTILTG